jgi:hypothetical protein
LGEIIDMLIQYQGSAVQGLPAFGGAGGDQGSPGSGVVQRSGFKDAKPSFVIGFRLPRANWGGGGMAMKILSDF